MKNADEGLPCKLLCLWAVGKLLKTRQLLTRRSCADSPQTSETSRWRWEWAHAPRCTRSRWTLKVQTGLARKSPRLEEATEKGPFTAYIVCTTEEALSTTLSQMTAPRRRRALIAESPRCHLSSVFLPGRRLRSASLPGAEATLRCFALRQASGHKFRQI